ncbi:CshA/CshB family fibrillar adhesin-related protein [Bifidobacterium sp. ESL0784]|nr:CshA/CshB family fibrillar adhesin-related protein [Bifidobacterium sp. ESL0784]MDF7640034.1 CshA/CshB family fibrillar adhesin-related protein [Bifidobacterium sp. ESL0784]
MVTGLENKIDGEKVSFDFSCSAYLIPSATDPSSTLNDSTNVTSFTEVPLQGLVFADAESNNWAKYPIMGGYYEQEEYIKATHYQSRRYILSACGRGCRRHHQGCGQTRCVGMVALR